MPVDFYIKREKGKPQISLEEWKDFVAKAEDFRLTDELPYTNPGDKGIMTIKAPNCGLWTSKALGEVPFRFSIEFGMIIVSRPNEIILKKAREIAEYFGTDVFCDGEKI